MNNKELKKISDLIIKELNPERIILFGSRSKGHYSESSDYDLAIDSNKMSFRNKRKLIEKIDSIIGLHSVDLVFLRDVDVKFRNIIFKTGKVVYER